MHHFSLLFLNEFRYFHETEDAHEVQATIMKNEMPYALISKENGLAVIINSSDFLSLDKKSKN